MSRSSLPGRATKTTTREGPRTPSKKRISSRWKIQQGSSQPIFMAGRSQQERDDGGGIAPFIIAAKTIRANKTSTTTLRYQLCEMLGHTAK